MVSLNESQLKKVLDAAIKELKNSLKARSGHTNGNFQYFFANSIDLGMHLKVLSSVDSQSTVYYYDDFVFKVHPSLAQAALSYTISQSLSNEALQLEEVLSYFGTQIIPSEEKGHTVNSRVMGPTYAKRFLQIKNSSLSLQEKKRLRDHGIQMQLIHNAFLEARVTPLIDIGEVNIKSPFLKLIEEYSKIYEIKNDSRLNESLSHLIHERVNKYEDKVSYTDRNPTNLKLISDTFEWPIEKGTETLAERTLSLDFDKASQTTIPAS